MNRIDKIGTTQINAQKNETNVDKTEDQAKNKSIWSGYDSQETGRQGVIDEAEVEEFVQGNLGAIAGNATKTLERWRGAFNELKNFIGSKWSDDTTKEMTEKLNDYVEKAIKTDTE